MLPLDPEGWLVYNALVVQRPRRDEAHPLGEAYVGPRGMIVQCSSCRRVRHGRDLDRWDWVPEVMQDKAVAISHGPCEPCLGFCFPPPIEPGSMLAAQQ